MNVEAYIIAWNESETIHLTIKHYQQFCTRIVVYDNWSDDGTPEICKAMGCEVKQFGIPGVLDDREYTNLKNNCWKGSTADWVIVVDADEILAPQSPNHKMKYILSINKGIGILSARGWNVHSYRVPQESWFEETHGVEDENYSKMACFNPEQIKEIQYVHGCHVANPKSRNALVIAHNEITLFHYRNVGGPQRLVDRHALYRQRLSEWNLKWKAGDHYNHEDERRIREWNERYERSKEYSPLGTSY